MIRMRPRVLTAVCAVVLGLSASVASAQATRTWVSGVGSDANPCSRTAPCQTFAGAFTKTAAGGEISVLDPGGFGTVNITKAITIDGAGDGLNGIRFIAGKQLVVEHVTISGFTNRGIDMVVGATANLIMNDVSIFHTNKTNVAGNNTVGIRVQATAGFAVASLNDVRLEGLSIGLEANQNSRVNITNSVASANASTGILASHATAVVNADTNQIGVNDVAGVNASVSGATIRLANNHIYNNSNGIMFAAGATINSDGRNRVVGNGATTAPNGAAIPLQ